MRKLLGSALQWVAIVLGVAMVAFGAWIYLIEVYDPKTGLWSDSLGRPLTEGWSVFGSERSTGLLWQLVDLAIAVVALGALTGLHALGEKLKPE